MAKTRLHKILQNKTVNLFNHVEHDGKPLGCVNAATDKCNTKWADYEEVCVETYGLDIAASAKQDLHELLVLRGHVRCCCGGVCPYPADHDLTQGGAFSKVGRHQSIDAPKNVDHYPGQDYTEATIHYNDLLPIQTEATQRKAAGTLAGLAKEITDETTPLGLSAEDIESQLGVVGADENGLLSAQGAAATVLAGTNTNTDDYLWVSAFVILFQRLLGHSHNRLSKDWPQRSKMTSHMFQPK
jgi:hypothetical protein